MNLNINLTPALERRIKHYAKTRNLNIEEVLKRILFAWYIIAGDDYGCAGDCPECKNKMVETDLFTAHNEGVVPSIALDPDFSENKELLIKSKFAICRRCLTIKCTINGVISYY